MIEKRTPSSIHSAIPLIGTCNTDRFTGGVEPGYPRRRAPRVIGALAFVALAAGCGVSKGDVVTVPAGDGVEIQAVESPEPARPAQPAVIRTTRPARKSGGPLPSVTTIIVLPEVPARPAEPGEVEFEVCEKAADTPMPGLGVGDECFLADVTIGQYGQLFPGSNPSVGAVVTAPAPNGMRATYDEAN